MKQDSQGSFVRALGMGVLLGASAGIVLGLLFAPEEGSRMRRRISYHLEGVCKQMTDFLETTSRDPRLDNEARRHGQALVSEVHERAQEISDKIDAVLGDVQARSQS